MLKQGKMKASRESKHFHVPQRLQCQRTILLHQPGDPTPQLDHAIEPMEMYQSRCRLVMYLLVDGEADHSSYGAVGNGEGT